MLPASDHTSRRTPSTLTTWTGAPAGRGPLTDRAVQVSLLTRAMPVGANAVTATPSEPGRAAAPRGAKLALPVSDGGEHQSRRRHRPEESERGEHPRRRGPPAPGRYGDGPGGGQHQDGNRDEPAMATGMDAEHDHAHDRQGQDGADHPWQRAGGNDRDDQHRHRQQSKNGHHGGDEGDDGLRPYGAAQRVSCPSAAIARPEVTADALSSSLPAGKRDRKFASVIFTGSSGSRHQRTPK